MRFATRILWLLVLIGPVSDRTLAALPAETRWAEPSFVQLNVEFPGDGYHASWELFRCDCGDLLVHADLNVPDESISGDLLLIERKAVLSRGFGKYRAEAASSLDAAALMLQLAARLLERSEPGGPVRVTEVIEVDLEDRINHINLDTGTAVGGFQAPWSIEGKISPLGDTRRRFDLRFHFTVPAEGGVVESSMRLFGEAEYAPGEFPVSGSSPLSGWDLSWRNEEDAVSGSPATLDELRALLRAD
jgi:hypothetical protein